MTTSPDRSGSLDRPGDAAVDAPHALADAPLAERGGLGAAWIVPALALVLAIALGWSYWSQRGAVVEVRFAAAHGLEAGSDVRFAGTSIGAVESVRLEGDGIVARLRLRDDALHLAREGSQWWIPRPRVSLAGVDGLETLLGARYVTVRPGREGGAVVRRFDGLDDAPVDVPWEGGLELVLESARLGGLAPGGPVRFRQVDVGRITAVELASDGGSVLVRASVAPDYAELVRTNSVFWNASGISLEAGLLSGLDFSVDSLEALLTGAIAFATPPAAAAPASNGARFQLAERAKEEWTEWVSHLPVGAPRSDAVAPVPTLAVLTWERDRLIGTAKERRQALCLRLQDGWLAPRGVFERPDAFVEGTLRLVVGPSDQVVPDGASDAPNLRFLPADRDARGWPRDRVRAPLDPENCLVHGPDGSLRALDATRLSSADGSLWLVAGDDAIDASWHGAPVTARSDGRLIGLLLSDGDGARIAVDVPVAR